MKPINHYFRVVKQTKFGFRPVLGYCSISLFAVLFFCGQLSLFAANNTEAIFVSNDFIVNASDHSLYNEITPHYLPFESAPKPQLQLDPNDNLTEDDSNDEGNSLFHTYLPGRLFTISSRESSFSPITYSTQNRSTVPLFILNHSWKNFIV